MFFPNRPGESFRRCAALLALLLGLAAAPAQAQTSPPGAEAPAAGSTREIAVAPNARDAQIADRLERILQASGWFAPLSVAVREGIVFIDGQTETDDRREWAQQLALRTQDVVAVVNRIEVRPTISWDFTPTWRELGRMVDRAHWLAPLAVMSVTILLVFWLLSRGAARLTRHALRRRLAEDERSSLQDVALHPDALELLAQLGDLGGLVGRARPDAERRRRLLSSGRRRRRAAHPGRTPLSPTQPGADQTIRQPQFGRHLRGRATATHRGNRLPFEPIGKTPTPYHTLHHRHLQALQPIKGVRSGGAGPVSGGVQLQTARALTDGLHGHR